MNTITYTYLVEILQAINGRNANEVVALPEAHDEGDIAFNNWAKGKTAGAISNKLKKVGGLHTPTSEQFLKMKSDPNSTLLKMKLETYSKL